MLIIIHINNNNNNNFGRLKDLILLCDISMGTQKNFFEVYRKFGHVPSERFARLGIGGWVSLDGYRRDYIKFCQVIDLEIPGL